MLDVNDRWPKAEERIAKLTDSCYNFVQGSLMPVSLPAATPTFGTVNTNITPSNFGHTPCG
eukprot:5984414-Amphidinium_carterae.1